MAIEEPLKFQRVAVTVFAEVEAVDAHDGAYILERFLSGQQVRRGEVHEYTVRIDHEPREIRVHQVMDAGMAVGNGYMWLEPTGKAFPREVNES